MKKKEIITVIFSLIIIGVAVYFAMTFLFPKKNTAVLDEKKVNTVVPVQREFDKNTLDAVDGFEDYGKPQLDNLGKEDLFSGF